MTHVQFYITVRGPRCDTKVRTDNQIYVATTDRRSRGPAVAAA